MTNRRYMKNTCLLLLLLSSRGFAQNKAAADSVAGSLEKLFVSTQPADQAVLKQRLYGMLNSRQEDDWQLAANFFYRLKEQNVYDSIAGAIKQQFPEGKLVRDEKVKVVFEATDPVQKEQLFKQWIAKYAPERFGSDRIVYDYARNAVAQAYANADSVSKAMDYANSIESPFWKGEGWAGTAGVLLKNGHAKEAAILYKKAVDQSQLYVNMPDPDNAARFAATGYAGYCVAYAQLLYNAKAYDSALVYIEKAYRYKKGDNVVELYATLLMTLNRNTEAMGLMENMVKQGKASGKMEENLKQVFVKVKGSDAGYGSYINILHDSMVVNVRAKAVAQMIKKPAPGFMLKDLDGKEVSLEALKGKIVVLDFWATWCGPCKRSFPAMQQAVNKYKADANVQFLFIDTWEHVPDARPMVSSFIKNNNYTFEVLLDGKDAVTNTSKVVESYGVKGIPAKFIIDPQGNIRFQLTGFEGSNESAVAELSAMIELARHS